MLSYDLNYYKKLSSEKLAEQLKNIEEQNDKDKSLKSPIEQLPLRS